MAESHDRPAPLWRRAVAMGVDLLAMWTVLFALQVMGLAVWVRGHSDAVSPDPWGSAFLAIVTVAAFHAVLSVVCTARLGQTPGMELVGVRVVRHGEVPSLARTLRRWAVPGLAIALPPAAAVVVLLITAAPALLVRDRATVADLVSGTRVVLAGRVAPRPGRSAGPRLIRVGMEKMIAGVTGDTSVLRETDDRR